MKDIIKNYLQVPFLICVAAIVLCSIYISYRKDHYGITLIKKALPLKKPFDLMDETALAPYKLIHKRKITNKDILESLGTESYLQWTLEDETVCEMSPVRHCSLFVTYYTGNPDQVPHVPEACYTGGGHQIADKASIKLHIADANIADVPATSLTFKTSPAEIWQAESKFTVIYFFKVNNLYKGNRTSTRFALGDLTNEYSYFSKVEVKFFNKNGLYPERDETIAATEKVLSKLLPALEKYHWPDWNTTSTPNK
ncbi:MAG: hypothetical protein K8R02_05760 [Anaerohalosphaeraceae bacterium]|nr:hypothetical protein [Anaerohalosphaeraceae bacterium]